jgi:hypothetical protein
MCFVGARPVPDVLRGGGGGVAHAGPEIMQSLENVGVAPQQARHKDAEEEDHEGQDEYKSNQGASTPFGRALQTSRATAKTLRSTFWELVHDW